MLAQEIGGNSGRAFVIDIDPRIQLAHGFIVEECGQRLELSGQLRVGVEINLTHHGRGGVVREVVLVVCQQLQLEGVEATVGGVDQAGKHLAITQRGVDQAGVHLPGVLAGQVHVVQLDHAGQAVGAVGELGVQGDQAVGVGIGRDGLGQVADAVDLGMLSGHLLRQRQGVGVAEPRRGEPDQAFFRVGSGGRQDGREPKIGVDDLRRVAKELGENLEEDELQAMIEEFDIDNDGMSESSRPAP